MAVASLLVRVGGLAVALAAALLASACAAASGASVEPSTAPATAAGGATPPTASGAAPGVPIPALKATATATVTPRLGFEDEPGKPVPMENGGRVPLGADKMVEVFLAPYPPDWQTDLHLFFMDAGTYKPLSDLKVDLTYEMAYMDHGVDRRVGQQVGDGHYALPLSFLMYGDWRVDVTVKWPEGARRLRFIVKFFPR